MLRRSIFVIDRTRFTSAGGVGAFDMMLDIIERQHGATLARGVAEWFVHDRIRADADREKLQLRVRTGIRSDLVLAAVARMEEKMELGETVAACHAGEPNQPPCATMRKLHARATGGRWSSSSRCCVAGPT